MRSNIINEFGLVKRDDGHNNVITNLICYNRSSNDCSKKILIVNNCVRLTNLQLMNKHGPLFLINKEEIRVLIS